LVGNPYPSPVDWESIAKNNVSTTYYVWDPTLSGSSGRGAYVAYNGITHTNNNASSFVDKNIQMGQAFFVQTSANGTASLDLLETNKTAANTAVFRTNNAIPKISVQLFVGNTNNKNSADGSAVLFDNAFSALNGQEDAGKLLNPDENISFASNGKLYSIEGRPKVNEGDSLQIELSQLSSSNYTLSLNATNLSEAGTNLHAYLLDRLNNTKQQFTDSLNLAFTATNAMADRNRFMIVFEANKNTLSTSPLLIQVYPNPASKSIQVLYTNQVDAYTTITITSNAGAKIKSIHLGKVKEVKEVIDISKLARGVYYLQIQNGTETKTEKVVIH
jgi:hypothetical protein